MESDIAWEDKRVNARQAPVSSYDEALKLRRGTEDSASKAKENWYDHISLDPCFFCFGLDDEERIAVAKTWRGATFCIARGFSRKMDYPAQHQADRPQGPLQSASRRIH